MKSGSGGGGRGSRGGGGLRWLSAILMHPWLVPSQTNVWIRSAARTRPALAVPQGHPNTVRAPENTLWVSWTRQRHLETMRAPRNTASGVLDPSRPAPLKRLQPARSPRQMSLSAGLRPSQSCLVWIAPPFGGAPVRRHVQVTENKHTSAHENPRQGYHRPHSARKLGHSATPPAPHAVPPHFAQATQDTNIQISDLQRRSTPKAPTEGNPHTISGHQTE